MKQKDLIIKQLREIADILKPFTNDHILGAKRWDGANYVNLNEPQIGYPFARVWWCTLGTMADLLEISNYPLDQKHIDYIHSECLSGMGSLLDFGLDQSEWGTRAKIANERLGLSLTKLSKLINETD